MKMETKEFKIKLATIVLDSKDANALADFYERLLGWTVTFREPNWALTRHPSGNTGLAFQTEEDFRPPIWPEQPGEQQKMLHLDFGVDDLEAAKSHALRVGARMADEQFLEDVVVFFDPDGHPFCLFKDASL